MKINHEVCASLSLISQFVCHSSTNTENYFFVPSYEICNSKLFLVDISLQLNKVYKTVSLLVCLDDTSKTSFTEIT